MSVEYTNLKIPTEFVQKLIDPLVENKAFGYTSRANVVIDAVRLLNEKIGGK